MLDGSSTRRKGGEGYLSASDEEILPLEGLSEDDYDEDEDDDEIESEGEDDVQMSDEEERDEEEDLDKEAWGSSRRAYYGADDVSDDEEIAQEEQEAERLQKKHLARLQQEDFLDTWGDATPTSNYTPSTGRVTAEELPAPDMSKMSKSDILKLLKTRHPDVPRLAALFQRLHPQLSSLTLLAQRPFHPQHSIIKIKLACLSVLLSSLALFFALRADKKERKSTEKKLLTKITELETAWNQINTIPIDENAVDIQELVTTETNLDNLLTESNSQPKLRKTNDITKPRKRTAQTLADDSDSDDLAATLAVFKKARTKSLSKTTDTNDLSDFADRTVLHPLEAQEKSTNKRSLRFYTSQIEQRGAKRREKYSGDTEVFKERRNDRNERQVEAARKRGLLTDQDETALDDSEPVVPSSAVAAGNADDDDYYNFIEARTAKKKAHGKEEYETSKAVARAYLLGETEEPLDESGKRLITRQIEKNKGLMPKRSKDVRNPRVKKRKKYEKKKIALKGRQQVYQIKDRRRGAYGGEETGISKNVVKGVKLG
jgi:U3 small nucleolar RNA-associated protein 3